MLAQTNEYGMNIHMIGFNLPQNLIKGDTIKVKVTTHPEHYTAKFTISKEKIEYSNKILSINVRIPSEEIMNVKNGKTEMILFSIKSKDQLQNMHKIAVARLLPSDFPQISKNHFNLPIHDQVKTIKLYKTNKKQLKEFYRAKENGLSANYQISDHNTIKRDCVGEMKIQITLCNKYENITPKYKKNERKNKIQKPKKNKNSFDNEESNIHSMKPIKASKLKNKGEYSNFFKNNNIEI